ncbi:MAG: TRAP transporter large permease subunit, partial [Acidobacteriota bacterium]
MSPGPGGQSARPIGPLVTVLGTAICLLTLLEVNYPHLAPPAQLALFALLGLVLCFRTVPASKGLRGVVWARAVDLALAGLSVLVFGYMFIQNEPLLRSLWVGGQSLGNRAGTETVVDIAVGVVGLLLILEAARRSLGMALPLLAVVFLAYGYFGPWMPLFPHRGYGVERLVAQSFLHSQGVFGIAMNVMFTYVFLFVVFGAFLQATGATGFIIRFADRIFHGSPGGPAKVAVVSCGMMGSLSGSAVATCAVVGTLTIPTMKSAGFRSKVAGGIAAAASSGGALMPPVMGAGAYMMLEIVQPSVTYLEIIRAALLPAILYYASLLLIVHFSARLLAGGGAAAREVAAPQAVGEVAAQGRSGEGQQSGGSVAGRETPARERSAEAPSGSPLQWEGVIFGGALTALVVLLVIGNTPFRAVTLALATIVVLAAFTDRTRLAVNDYFRA